MRAVVVAKKDYRDAIRSWELWGLTALLFVFTAGMFYALTSSDYLTFIWAELLPFYGGANFGLTTEELIGFFVGPAGIMIPVVALVITHKAVAGEVESGSVKFLISVPLTRGDAILGKLVGRAVVLWSALLVALLLAGVVAIYKGVQFDPLPYALFILLTFLFGLTYVSIGVGLSALADTGSRAILYAVSVFASLEVLFGSVPNVFWYALHGDFIPDPVQTPGIGDGPPDAPGWFYFIERLAPGASYRAVANGYFNPEEPVYFAAAFDDIPVYLTKEAAVVVLLVWVVVPVTIGYLRFRRTDIS